MRCPRERELTRPIIEALYTVAAATTLETTCGDRLHLEGCLNTRWVARPTFVTPYPHRQALRLGQLTLLRRGTRVM